jgi:hypothetical protein
MSGRAIEAIGSDLAGRAEWSVQRRFEGARPWSGVCLVVVKQRERRKAVIRTRRAPLPTVNDECAGVNTTR